jgi:uncharacterized protein related to proFAR isomerase
MDLIPAVSVRAGLAVLGTDGGEYRPVGSASRVISKLSERFERVLIVDIDAIEGAGPQLDLVQELAEEDTELWVDMGARVANDLVHPFVAGASVIIVGTKCIRDVGAYASMYRVSGEVVPSLEVSGGSLVWRGDEPPSIAELLKSLRGMGYVRLAVADLGRRAAGAPLDESLVGKAVAIGFEVYAGGGVTEADVPRLEALGAKGALLELRSVLGEEG